MPLNDPLARYQAKRNFSQTPEPAAGGIRSDKALQFVIQKHAARQLHYDFRLELHGTLKSWAVPKGPSLDPHVKRMAVQVEDHPMAYAGFEGTIPPGQYGAGHVIVWDRGLWVPMGDPVAGLKNGKLKFELHGEKLKGSWALVRMQGRSGEEQPPWLLMKERDDFARAQDDYDVLQALPDSVLTGLPLPSPSQNHASAAKDTATKKTTKKTATTKAKEKPNASPKSLKAKMPAASDPSEGAVKAALPETLQPQLATLVTEIPATKDDWVYEIKFDGYRLLARIEGDSVRCMTRNGNDWTGKLPELAAALGRLGIASAWLDGEIVVINAHGLPDFGALQNAFDSASAARIVYYVFDLPFYEGADLRQVRLERRREILQAILANRTQPEIRFSEAFDRPPEELLASAREIGLEGIIGKRKDSAYTASRSPDWIKLKTRLRQEFVVGGYTEPKGSRTALGALLLGVHDEAGQLVYAGKVGTGFDRKTLHALKTRLLALHADKPPFADLPASVKGQWVKPELVAEVAFGEWTHAGRIRHAVFQGLRADKPAQAINRERPVTFESTDKDIAVTPAPLATAAKAVQKATSKTETLRITHGERVIDATSGFTKKDLVLYYASVAECMLPHLKTRPVALMRAPAGIEGELFFQKHAEARHIPGIKLLDPALDPGHAPLLQIPSVRALLGAAQFNVVEFHTWNATSDAISQPDRMTFDLDPGQGIEWPQVQEAAQLVRALLDELGLPGFLKTSGGKGLHVVVPLKRDHGFDTVKDFSHAIVKHLARVIPQRFVAKSGPQNRVGKIFVDYLRNGFGATTVAAWSVRARPGLGVSVPLAWDELASLTGSAHWTARSLGARLETGNQPWARYEASRTGLSDAMKKLGFKPAA